MKTPPGVENTFFPFQKGLLLVGFPTEKSKVHQFQICCARTKYLSEIQRPDNNSSCRKAIFRQFASDLKGLSAKIWAKFGSSDF